MHVPDGIVPLWLQIILFVASGLAIAASIRIVNRRFDDRLVPYMGVLAAVIFAAQLVNFPIPPFSSGHLVGSTLLAVMVGPWVATLIMALVLFVQALYGDGGILTLGLNFFNMGVFSVFLGYGLGLLLYRGASRLMGKKKAVLLSAGVASFIVTVSAAFVLGIQLLTVVGFGQTALVAITSVHVLIGIGEALLTTLILLYFVKANPSLVSLIREDDSRESAYGQSQTSADEDVDAPSYPEHEKPLRPLVATAIVTIALVSLVILTGLASGNPDGFEWALFVFAGVPEAEGGFPGLWLTIGEGPVVDIVTGSIGILAVLGLGILVFRRASQESHNASPQTGKFLLPFAEGKRSPAPFSPAGMIIAAIVLAVIVTIQTSLLMLLILLAMILGTGTMSGTRWRRVISLATKFELIILFWLVLEPFLYGSTVMLTLHFPWGPVYAYWEGLMLGLAIGLRMFAILLVFLATLSHMTLSEFIGALKTLRVPTAILGSLLVMFRYVPLFIEERSRMQEAQLLRGYDRGKGLARLRSTGYLVGTTIDRAFDRSARVYESMTLRGFGKGMMISSVGFRRSDSLLPVLLFSLVMAIVFLLPPIMEAILL
ncbi:MAG: energy-coupling factor ABC transporter permease [Candidatus Thorarchaeota archaeon]|nr:MAG: energy-coupling factor ABC transporter permease [Candidatus Thorarchaeota archaeon]